MKKPITIGVIGLIVVISGTTIHAQQSYEIPTWIKTVAGFWAEEKISDDEFGEALTFLINQGIIKVYQLVELKQEIIQLQIENDQLKNRLKELEHFGESDEISIIGDDSCRTKTMQSLELLNNKAKKHYEIVTTHIGIIECVDEGSGIRVWEDPPRFIAGKETVDGGTIWYAGTIAHDSCHSYLYSEYFKDNPQSDSVPSDVYSGKTAEAFCLGFQYDALVLIGASQSTLDYVENIIDSEYWEIPYEDRWW